MLTLKSHEFNTFYNKFFVTNNKEMSNKKEEDIYEECKNQAYNFLKNIELTGSYQVKNITKFSCLYPSLLEYNSAIKIQKWWERMREKLLVLNHIKYQQCEDCGKWRKSYTPFEEFDYKKYRNTYDISDNLIFNNAFNEWKKNQPYNELMIEDACADYLDCSHLGRCCIKYVCKDNKCSYLLTCCDNITLRNKDNFKDNEKDAEIKCEHCNTENKIKLTWYGLSTQEYIDKYN